MHVAPMGADAMELGRVAVATILAAGWRQVPEFMPPEIVAIAEERQRAIAARRTAEHDAQHDCGELARAAAVYAAWTAGVLLPTVWPFGEEPELWSETSALVKAGELIAAEIARRQHVASQPERQEQRPEEKEAGR